MKSWRAIPPVWRIGLGLDATVIAVYAVYWVLRDPTSYEFSPRFFAAAGGASYAVHALCVVGALQLARRQSGLVRAGLWIVAATYIANVAIELGSQAIFQYADQHRWQPETYRTISTIQQHVWFAVALIAVIGLAIALWRERLAVAIGGLVAALVTHPPPELAKLVFGGLDLGFRGGQALHMAFALGHLAVVIAMLLFVARGEELPDPARAAAGMRRAAAALWLRVAAAVLVPLLAIAVVAGSHAGEGAVSVWRALTLAGATFNIVALALFVFGVLGTAAAALPDLGRWLLAGAGTAGAWCAGVTLYQLVPMYRTLYGSGGEDEVLALSVAMPLVATASVALVAIAICNFGARSGNEELRRNAATSGIVFVVLMLASTALQGLLVNADSTDSALPLMVIAAIAGLIAMIMIARMVRAAAAALEREPSLPTARVLS